MAFEYEEALLRLGRLPGERLPEIAIAMLQAGYDNQAVREVAALTRPTLSDAADLFSHALRALGRKPLDRRMAVLQLRSDILTRIADGTVEPVAGAREAWKLASDFREVEDLYVFSALEDTAFPFPERRADIAREIVNLAVDLLAKDRAGIES